MSVVQNLPWPISQPEAVPACSSIRFDPELWALYENLDILPGTYPPSLFGKTLGAFVNTRAMHGTRVLDLACGAGHLGITAALNGAIVDASDIAPEAIVCTQKNAIRAGVGVDARLGSGFDCWPEGRWQTVIVNGPGFEPLPEGKLDDATLNGLQRIKPIPRLTEEVFRQARQRLAPSGQIIGMVGGTWALGGIHEEARRYGLDVEATQRLLYRGPLSGWGRGISRKSLIISRMAKSIGDGVEIEACIFVVRLPSRARRH